MAIDLHLIIGNKAYSSWSLRPWLAMSVQGLKFRETVIPLYRPDTKPQILVHSPAGKVPVLIHGDVAVWESLAILDYLAEAFPDHGWWPAGRGPRAAARAISAEMHAGFTALRSTMGMNVRRIYPAEPRTPEVAADIARVCEIWHDTRSRFGADGPFLFGAFSNADAMYAPVVTRLKTYGVTPDPVSQAYCSAILALPAMQAWYSAAKAEPWVIDKFERG